MKVSKYKILIFTNLLVITSILLFVYNDYITVANSYEGFNSINYSLTYLFFGFVFLCLMNIQTPSKIIKPSNFFIVFYSIIVVYSNVFFSSGFEYLESFELLLLFLTLYFPIICILLVKNFKLKIKFRYLSNDKVIITLLILFSLIFSIYVYYSSINIGSFDFINSYERRLQGREIFSSGLVISYLISILFNTVAPFLSFHSALKSNKMTLLISLLLCVLAYWSLGIKSIVVYVLIFYILGLIIKKKSFVPSYYIFFLFGLISILVIIEYLISNQSIIAQIILRRIFFVGAKLQNMYFDAFISSDLIEILYGKNIFNYTDVTYYIGSEYIGNFETNANTNTFLYFLLKFGVIGYLLNVLAVSGILFFLDSIFLKNKSYIVLFTGIFFSILICESSFTTSLFTSGIMIFIIFSYYTKLRS